ncbi:PRP38 family protein [Babesia caballi]|uniref:Pre-mRNA-splicing factor 38 n=1 Tax=Babesia caballi TaxID=5871 RepID=A0AAV4LNF9_BABCB|nr:PRP38 family protein [Babesia caballi]
MSALVDCTKSPYPRCCGFLYLRFVLPSDQLWDWFEPYLMDDESFVISVNPTRNTTIGEFCERLLVDEKYFNTVLPRLPTRFKNRYGPHLCSMAEHRRRRAENLENIDNFVAGETCSAFVRGEWVEGVIVSVSQYYPTVAVQLGADKQEDLDIGYVSLNKAHSKRSRGTESSTEHRHGGASGASSASKEDLLREFKRRQSERALAVGKVPFVFFPLSLRRTTRSVHPPSSRPCRRRWTSTDGDTSAFAKTSQTLTTLIQSHLHPPAAALPAPPSCGSTLLPSVDCTAFLPRCV